MSSVASWLGWRRLPNACPGCAMLTQGCSGASRLKYCSSAIPALNAAATSQPTAASRAPCSGARGHSSSNTAAVAAATK